MHNREFLMMPFEYHPGKYNVAGWYVSEKLDGIRVFWDGGLSRGIPTKLVPWASLVDPRTGKEKQNLKLEASGLWSKNGNPIMAPDWFLNQLPPIMLDGELWAGYKNQRHCRAICIAKKPTSRWNYIEFAVFSSPHPANFAFDGIIRKAHFLRTINMDSVMNFIHNRNIILGGNFHRISDGATFEEELTCLQGTFADGPIYLHAHHKLPNEKYEVILQNMLKHVLDRSGEGLILRDPTSQWEPRQVRTVLKYEKL